MNNWLTRLLSLFLIVVFIGGYQLTTMTRAAEAEVGRLSAELAEARYAREALEEALETVKETLREPEETASETGKASSKTGSAHYVPGFYEGSGQGFGGEVAVRVTVTEREIADIEILSHDGEDAAYFSYASQLIPDILEEQTWDVDVVSGATFSSNGIKAAVRAALDEASGHA